MVKKFQLQGNIEFADPQAAFSFLYKADEFVKIVHKNDPPAWATGWSEDGMREVHFTVPLDAPGVIRNIVGADSLIVKEVQKYTKQDNIFTISSEPSISLPNGDRFVTTGETILSPDEKGGCTVTVNMTVEFKGSVWGLQGAVESFMESQARTFFEEWLTMARGFCKEKMGQSKDPLPEGVDDFFDIEDDAWGDGGQSPTEELERNPSKRVGTFRNQGRLRSPSGRNRENSMGFPMWFLQTFLKGLSILQISSEGSLIHLKKLNAKLLKIEKDLIIFNKWCLYGLGIATGLALGLMFRRQGSKSRSESVNL